MTGLAAVLQMDRGNSRLKWRLVCDGRVCDRGVSVDALAPEADWRDCSQAPAAVLVSSVAGEQWDEQLSRQLRDRFGVAPWFARTAAETAGLRNSYAQPERLGVDRWLAMLGAREQVPQRVCVVDAGSALTIDFVAADGMHEGGYIIPGPTLMERALLADTQRVRFAESADYRLDPGRGTAEAVRHGAMLAQCGALTLALSLAGGQGERIAVVITGGGGRALLALVPVANAVYREDLVFEGLEIMAREAAVIPP